MTLTDHQRAVLFAYARTGSYKDAAEELGLAVSTVRNLLAAVRDRLGVNTSIEALWWELNREKS